MAANKKKLTDQLLKPGTVLRDGDFAVVHAWGRWHLLTISLLNDNLKGIHTAHFMSAAEVDDYFKDADPDRKVEHFEEVSKDFADEVETKLLEKAEDYLPLLEAGYVDLGVGITTDTLHHIQFSPMVRYEWEEDIRQMMKEGGPGPYLRFLASHKKIRPAPDFDALSNAAFAKGATIEDQNALWTLVMKLKQWQFIARGEFPNVQPYVCSNKGFADGEPMLKAFTDADKLMAFAKVSRLTDENESVHILAMEVNGFIKTAAQYEAMGVWGIHFNPQNSGFYAPLTQLQPIWDFLKKHGRL